MSHSAKLLVVIARDILSEAYIEQWLPPQKDTWQANHQYSSSYHMVEEMPLNKTDSKALGVQVFKFKKAKTQK